MSKRPAPPELDRRRVARLASDGEPSAVLAEITGLPRLEIEAAIQVDPQIVELKQYYERLARESPETRAARLRRLLLAAVERALEDGELRNIGWALKGLGLLEPLPGSGLVDVVPRAPDDDPSHESQAIDQALAEFDDPDRELWEKMGYENWPVPPTIPWQPGAPRPRGPLTVENEAGTEAERSNAPLPWPPPRSRGEPGDAPVQAAVDQPAELGVEPKPPPGPDGSDQAGSSSRWPPHLRPV